MARVEIHPMLNNTVKAFSIIAQTDLPYHRYGNTGIKWRVNSPVKKPMQWDSSAITKKQRLMFFSMTELCRLLCALSVKISFPAARYSTDTWNSSASFISYCVSGQLKSFSHFETAWRLTSRCSAINSWDIFLSVRSLRILLPIVMRITSIFIIQKTQR